MTYRKKTYPTHLTESFAGVVVQEKTSPNKRLVLNAPKYLRHFLNTKCQSGEKVMVSITTKKWRRSLAQNAYLWGVYYPLIAQATGHSADEIHEWAKGVCLSTRIAHVMGVPVRLKKSTTELTVGEFCEFVLAIEEKTGIAAPPPENYDLAPLSRPLTPVRKGKTIV